jgi:sigma-B regulation protein RsbU (phosphoserine phosphatase)
LVTDGVTDQMGGGNQTLLAFGYKRMLAVLQASSAGNAAHLAQQLLAAVSAWQGTQTRRDDVTILALEI